MDAQLRLAAIAKLATPCPKPPEGQWQCPCNSYWNGRLEAWPCRLTQIADFIREHSQYPDATKETAADLLAAGSTGSAGEPLPPCRSPGPDSWDLLPQGGSYCSLPRGHSGEHWESGAPRPWSDTDD
ncbi:hypothetical protein [Streptomyces sp. NBC_01565]|uniref:hypothetical protein n=1 Tax=unclassified Streptomyces TaxID=2593676 RepID=UPI00224DA1CB|nr:hypothetical protein [Streptomyces sp. NBC_01565]MCX4546296.1 hypothetical protein [Streptomyces sp. NBC_01565]